MKIIVKNGNGDKREHHVPPTEPEREQESVLPSRFEQEVEQTVIRHANGGTEIVITKQGGGELKPEEGKELQGHIDPFLSNAGSHILNRDLALMDFSLVLGDEKLPLSSPFDMDAKTLEKVANAFILRQWTVEDHILGEPSERAQRAGYDVPVFSEPVKPRPNIYVVQARVIGAIAKDPQITELFHRRKAFLYETLMGSFRKFELPRDEMYRMAFTATMKGKTFSIPSPIDLSDEGVIQKAHVLLMAKESVGNTIEGKTAERFVRAGYNPLTYSEPFNKEGNIYVQEAIARNILQSGPLSHLSEQIMDLYQKHQEASRALDKSK